MPFDHTDGGNGTRPTPRDQMSPNPFIQEIPEKLVKNLVFVVLNKSLIHADVLKGL